MWILCGSVDEGPEETGLWRRLWLRLFQEDVLRLVLLERGVVAQRLQYNLAALGRLAPHPRSLRLRLKEVRFHSIIFLGKR